MMSAPVGYSAEADAPPPWVALGIGGGGAFFHAAGSPHDPNLVFVSTDMGELFRSTNAGKSWQALDWRVIMHSRPPVFHPTDPNVIYARSMAGGTLKRSADRGVTWEVVGPNAPWRQEKVLTALTIDRGNPKLMLLAGAEGLYRTADGGATWSAVANAPGGFIGIHIDQTSPAAQRVCFGANGAGVYRSDDGGLTWAEKAKGLPWRELRSFCGGSDAAAKRVVLYCTIPSKAQDGQFAGGVWRSMDRGETWESAMGTGINVTIGDQGDGEGPIDQYVFLGQAETKPDTVYVTNRGTGYWPPYHYTVYRSDDTGKTWRACLYNEPRFRENNTELGWLCYDRSRGYGGQAQTFAVNAGNPDQAFYTNDGEVFITMNGGQQWYQAYSRLVDPQPGKQKRWASIGLEDTTTWRYVFDPHDQNRTYICYTDIGFARSEDRGQTWYYGAVGIPWANTVYDVVCDPDVPGLLFAACASQHDIPHWRQIQGATMPGGVCKSVDYGKTWAPFKGGLPLAPACSLVLDPTSPKDKRVLYAAMYGHGVFKSADGGATWVNKSTGIEPVQNRQVYSLQRSADGTLFVSVPARRKGRGLNEDLTGGLYQSDDGAETWRRISSDAIFRPIDFAVHPADRKTIYVAVMDGLAHEGGAYKTTDGGATWQHLTVPFDKNVCGYIEGYGMAINPKTPDTVYFLTNTHAMFMSRDAGKTWEELKYPKGPPFLNCQRMCWDPQDPTTVYIITMGSSILKGRDPALTP